MELKGKWDGVGRVGQCGTELGEKWDRIQWEVGQHTLPSSQNRSAISFLFSKIAQKNNSFSG